MQGVDMHQYLDDCLLKNQSVHVVKRHLNLTLFWVTMLGFPREQKKIHISTSYLRGSRNVLAHVVTPPHGMVTGHTSDQENLTMGGSQCWPVHISVLLSAPFSVLEWDHLVGTELGTSALIHLPADQSESESAPKAARIMLVAQFWPRQPWLHLLTSLFIDLQRIILLRENLLKNEVPGMFYPKTNKLKLTVAVAVGVAETASKARQESTCETDNTCLKHYRLWCVDRNVSLSGLSSRGGKSPKIAAWRQELGCLHVCRLLKLYRSSPMGTLSLLYRSDLGQRETSDLPLVLTSALGWSTLWAFT